MKANNIVNICDVSKEIFAGGDAPKGNMSIEKTSKHTIPIFSNGEANDGLYGYTDFYRVSEPSITISARGTIGYATIRTEPFVPIVRLIVITPKIEIVDIKYLYYAIKNYDFSGSGTSIPQLTVPMLKQYSFPLPPLPEQRHIAAVLDKVSELIALRKRQLDLLDEMVKARFVEMFGNPVRNEKGWEQFSLQELCDGIGDGLHGTPAYDDDGEFAFINGNNLMYGRIVVNSTTKRVNKLEYEKYYIDISLNAVLLSINGSLGKLAYYNDEKIILGKSACYCNLKNGINKIFIFHVMNSNPFQNFLEESSTKSTIKNVGLKAIREYKMIQPPIELQNQFADFVQQVNKSKATVQQGLDRLILLKSALMQEYFG